MKVFKIVSIRPSGELVSFNTSEMGSALDLEYAVDKVTVPKIPNSLLFAFLDFKDAKHFYLSNNLVHIKKAIFIAETSKYFKHILPQLDFRKKSIEQFWRDYKNPRDCLSNPIVEFINNYSTNVGCTDIKLIARISDDSLQSC